MKSQMIFLTLLLTISPLLTSAFPTVLKDVDLPQWTLFSGDDDDICPDLLVRCLKDGDVTKNVGDIGEQKFCRKGVKCLQCHSKKNTAQCNLKFLKDCGGSCEAQGSPI